ncbi:WD repeat-containing protein RUP2-like [Musa acuminata AAA Group]|uniref:WD repeat-containing protein RUP2-like n=1 Tax=Musa acuminata AAA Group TaxID=214697 RepID=UPI0031E07914
MLRGLVRTSPRHRRRRRYQLGGIARKIRIYSLRTLLPPEGHAGGAAAFYGHSTACDFYICTPAKLGSLQWLPASGCRVLGSGDYDGVVTESDEERRVEVFERDEHAGRHVRSVDYSPDGSSARRGDATAQQWDTRRGGKGCVGVARPGAAVCGVEFDPGGGPWVGVGSDDRHAYVYDVRAVSAGPVAVLAVHGRAVTYVRFAGGPGRAVVSSGTDGSHRLWDWVGGGGGGGVEEVRAYSGHANALRFVGMSVWRTGGGARVRPPVGGEPIWVRGFEEHGREAEGGFVSAISWRQAGETEAQEASKVLAGGSNGALQAFVCFERRMLGQPSLPVAEGRWHQSWQLEHRRTKWVSFR